MLILGLLGVYFDAVVVFFADSSLLFTLTVAILWLTLKNLIDFLCRLYNLILSSNVEPRTCSSRQAALILTVKNVINFIK